MDQEKDTENKAQNLPIFMCLGLSVGMAIGAVAGNIPIGMCMGMGIGVGLGAWIDYINSKKKDEDPEPPGEQEET